MVAVCIEQLKDIAVKRPMSTQRRSKHLRTDAGCCGAELM